MIMFVEKHWARAELSDSGSRETWRRSTSKEVIAYRKTGLQREREREREKKRTE